MYLDSRFKHILLKAQQMKAEFHLSKLYNDAQELKEKEAEGICIEFEFFNSQRAYS